MKTKMWLLFLLALAALVAMGCNLCSLAQIAPPTATLNPRDESDIRKLIADEVRFSLAKDVDRFKRLWTPDGFVILGNQTLEIKDMSSDFFDNVDCPWVTLENTITSISVQGDEATATVLVQGTCKNKATGFKQPTLYPNTTWVFAKIGGEWKIRSITAK
jgi:ketosteroid isomerase-like protein